MKIRNGFVSNSSSSSFILRNDKDIEFIKNTNVEYYSVDNIKKHLHNLYDATKVHYENVINCVPNFMFYEQGIYDIDDCIENSFVSAMLKALENLDGCYITESVDRDWAYNMNFNFETFMGDL